MSQIEKDKIQQLIGQQQTVQAGNSGSYLKMKRQRKPARRDKNKPKKVQTQEMKGLNLSHDPRTNSIIAKGVQSRIDKLAQSAWN